MYRLVEVINAHLTAVTDYEVHLYTVCLRTTQKVPESIAKTMFYFVEVCIFVLHKQDEVVCHYVHMQYCII